jgi:hypothetical protein
MSSFYGNFYLVPRGYLKKYAPNFLMKTARIGPLTALTKMAQNKFGVTGHTKLK